jgi:hypothetical protein
MRLNHEQRTLYREEILIGREEVRLRVLLPLTDEDEYVSIRMCVNLIGWLIYIHQWRQRPFNGLACENNPTHHRLFPITAQLTNIHLFKG